MSDETKLTEGLDGLAAKRAEKKQKSAVQENEKPLLQESEKFFEEKRKTKFLETLAEERKPLKKEALIKKGEQKNKKPKTATLAADEDLKIAQARKFQMMTQSNMEKAPSSPLQMHLIQSESLKIAQEKVSELEEEILSLREKNESLVSAGEVFQKNNESLKLKLDELKSSLNDEKRSFEEEKEILLSALEKAREELEKLANKKQELEKRISSSFQGIRQRENSLEGRIEILKMENTVMHKEKDKKILELRKDIQKLKYNLEDSHKKNRELQVLTSKLKESSRRAISALRATIYNLAGAKTNEETAHSQMSRLTKAS